MHEVSGGEQELDIPLDRDCFLSLFIYIDREELFFFSLSSKRRSKKKKLCSGRPESVF